MWIRTLDRKWYICEIRGAVFVTWVSDADKAHAAVFPENAALEFIAAFENMSGMRLQAVRPFS